MGVVAPFGHFERRLLDCERAHAIELVQLEVGAGARPLDETKRADESARHGEPADWEILHRALRLRAPQRVGGHSQLAHAVAFHAEAVACHALALLITRSDWRRRTGLRDGHAGLRLEACGIIANPSILGCHA
jgi:hypothetical protein